MFFFLCDYRCFSTFFLVKLYVKTKNKWNKRKIKTGQALYLYYFFTELFTKCLMSF